MTPQTSPSAKVAVTTPPASARSVPASEFLRAIHGLGVTHLITVPDTHLKSLIAALEQAQTPRLINVCTEDEAIALNAGLYIGGQKPMLLIQNNGFLASINALKGISLDAQVPTLLLIGEFGRDVARPSRENPLRAVRMVEPTLELWGVPYYRIEGPEDLGSLAEAWRRADRERGPVAVLVGAPTS